MSKTLIIVESPAKARTIGRFLGSNDILVQASMGHIRDLPERSLGIDIGNDFRPEYELTANGKKVIRNLKSAATGASEIYLATDPDREGEAIAWHLQTVLKGTAKANFHRITFHEITRSAIDESFRNPGEIAMNLVDAQQARRVLDRLVGYQVSPLLWKNVRKGTSAGRVQSVALRLIVEREREIQAFQPEEYWNLDAIFQTSKPKATLKTKLNRINGLKIRLANEATVRSLAEALQASDTVHRVAHVITTDRTQKPAPPFITSTLQQAAGSFLKYGTTQTMRFAQELYEGVELGNAGAVGLITYMRTDSVNIAKEAQDQARRFIRQTYGNEYVPAKPNVYHSRQTAQEAHEAIRPTDVNRTPDSLKPYLSSGQFRLYSLIWNRFIASQMAPAKQKDHAIEIESSGTSLDAFDWRQAVADDSKAERNTTQAPGTVCTFRAASRETVFPGYLAVYSFKDLGTEDELDDKNGSLPPLPQGLPCQLDKLDQEQCFTAPPSRFSEASLVKALEQNGVGRPSTFASTIKTIMDREYVAKEKNSLAPTTLGFQVNDYLVGQMPNLFDVGFTALMESQLDEVEEGTIGWTSMLKDFYGHFQDWLGHAPVTLSATLTEGLAEKLDELFPAGFAFAPPSEATSRTYDDRKFIDSIRKRLQNGKDVTERQWHALISVVAKYAENDPEMQAKADKFGWGDNIRSAAQERSTPARQKTAANQLPLPAGMPELLKAMEGLTWKAPVKRGRRVFDDGHFFKSLARSAERNGTLTQMQIDALRKFSRQYAAQIPGYQELCATLGWQDTVADTPAETAEETPAISAEETSRLKGLLAEIDKITNWSEPSTRGRRTFDDRKFAMSLKEQFERKGELSFKQVAALEKLVAKYSGNDAMPAKSADQAGEKKPMAKTARPAAEPIGRNCPECQAPLVRRHGRFGTFISCSAYPKCHYTEHEKRG